MLEQYFIRPDTVDRIRGSWLGDSIEAYVTWLHDHDYRPRCVYHRVPLLVAFGRFATKRGVASIRALPDEVDAYVQSRLRHRARPCCSQAARQQYAREIRGPLEQFLRVVLGDTEKACVPRPFTGWAPGFFDHLRDDRGLSPTTIEGYAYQLSLFERFIAERGVVCPRKVSAVLLDSFLAERGSSMCARSLGATCAALRGLLKYWFREGTVHRDLSSTVDRPHTYALSDIPRSLSAEAVEHTLTMVDRRSPVGRRDFAMLLFLTVYGLRAREVAALRLDDIDWHSSVVHVRARKGGHSSKYPLIPVVGEAVLDYLRKGRPATSDRHLFLRCVAPRVPVTYALVSDRAKTHLRRAGVDVERPGSHTLRHSCAQRLVDAGFSLKVIGDFLGHRHPSATRVYTKVAINELRVTLVTLSASQAYTLRERNAVPSMAYWRGPGKRFPIPFPANARGGGNGNRETSGSA